MLKKTTTKKEPATKKTTAHSKLAAAKGRYIETVGRRKTSVARVRLMPNESGIKINGKDAKEYLKATRFYDLVNSPLVVLELQNKHGFTVMVAGGGIQSQAEAIRHGISRALVKLDADFRKRLKKMGFMKRDPRMVERKKYGLKKARKGPRWAKR